jgi:hypothetical protein
MRAGFLIKMKVPMTRQYSLSPKFLPPEAGSSSRSDSYRIQIPNPKLQAVKQGGSWNLRIDSRDLGTFECLKLLYFKYKS